MKYIISIGRGAAADLLEAYFYYEKQQRGLGEHFKSAVEGALRIVRLNPFRKRILHKLVRAAPLHVFPYYVVYQVERNRIAVLAVIHDKRFPKEMRKPR